MSTTDESPPETASLYTDKERRRFFKKVNKIDGGCWLWVGANFPGGYGAISIKGKPQRANRMSYRMHFGEFDENLWVLHKCDNPPCVNPEHLFLGTCRDNVHDMVGKGRWRSQFKDVPSCVNGHPFTEENTYRYTTTRGGPGRGCRTCRKLHSRESKRRLSLARRIAQQSS